MANKIGLLVCGNSGIDYLKVDYPIKVIRSTLIIDGKEFEDFVDITADEFYDIIVKNPDIDLHTSQAATGKFVEMYEEFKNEGYKDVIVVTISSKLSGTYQGAVLAKDLVEGINVHVLDSKSVSYGQAHLVYEAIKMIKDNIKAEQIFNKLNELRDKITIYVLVDTLKYLVKNGRLSATSGFIGTLLKIKPLLKITEDGSLKPYEKIRTTSKARSRLMEIVKEEIKGKNVKMFVAYTNNKEEAAEIREDIIKEFPNVLVELVPLTPVVGAHAGPGTIGVGHIEI